MSSLVPLAVAGALLLLRPEVGMSKERQDDAWRQAAEQRIEAHRKADLTIQVVDAAGRPVPGAEVRVEMTRHAYHFGAAVTAARLTDPSPAGQRYRDHVAQYFNKVTLENDLKWEQWELSASASPGDRFERTQTFEALRWLRERDIAVRGHYLSWGSYHRYPALDRAEDPDRFLEDLFDHIREKAAAVGDAVTEWDALNHPVHPAPGGKTLAQLFGWRVFPRILRTAERAAPSRRLYINEAEILPLPHQRMKAYEDLIEYLLERDAPLHGIGFMAHFVPHNLTPAADLHRVLDQFARFGLPLLITEFDISFGEPGTDYRLTPADERLQADYTRDFMTAVFSHPATEGIVMWAFWQGEAWYPGAQLYRDDWSPKPNGAVWEELVFDRWWTRESGTTDADGTLTVRGFLGDYAVRLLGGQEGTTCATLGAQGTWVVLTLGARPPADSRCAELPSVRSSSE